MLDQVKTEAEDRYALEQTDSYEFSLALIRLNSVSDASHFISELKEHIKKYDGHFPPDVVVADGRRLYAFMYGDEARTAETLIKFFGSPFSTSQPVAIKQIDLGYDVAVGFSHHTSRKSLSDMVREARNMSVRFRKLSAKEEEPSVETPTSRLEYLSKVG